MFGRLHLRRSQCKSGRSELISKGDRATVKREQKSGQKNGEKRESCAIVVLGCRPYEKDGSVNPELRARVGKGIELYQREFGDLLVFSGGLHYGGVPEAAVMKSWAGAIPKKDVVLEIHAASTGENAVFSKRVLLRLGIRSLVVVTSPYHVRRALRIFEGVCGKGFEVRGVACDYYPSWPTSWVVRFMEWIKGNMPNNV